MFIFFLKSRQKTKFSFQKLPESIDCVLYIWRLILIYTDIKQIQGMKIVLKHKNELKLYTEELDFDHILNFIQTQFKLSKQSLSMTFHDTEGDDITILTNEDFQIMQTILQGKQYVKINVEGKKIESIIQNEKMISVLQLQKVKQKPKELQKVQKLKATQSYLVEGPSENKEDQKQLKSQIQSEQQCQKSNQKDKSCKFKYFLNQMVTNLVDERLKSLLPCLKQQIKNSQQAKPFVNNSMTHQGIQCKGCSVIPIVGIRYKCPKCPNFNLCEQCQNKIQHQHNLLKIKHVEAEEKVQQHPCMRQFFRGCPRRQGEQRQQCRRWFHNKLAGLSFIFGGEPENYRSYVQQNQDLHPRQTFIAYAKTIGMPDELFRKKFIQWRCQKLSLTFGKPAQNFYNFVQQNYGLNYKQMVELLYQKGIQKREYVYPQSGRCYYNFKEFTNKKAIQLENQKEQQKIEVTESILKQPKPLDSPQVNRAKGNLFMKIKNLFPDAQNKEIYKFVDQTYSENKEQEEVIKLWVEKCFGK